MENGCSHFFTGHSCIDFKQQQGNYCYKNGCEITSPLINNALFNPHLITTTQTPKETALHELVAANHSLQQVNHGGHDNYPSSTSMLMSPYSYLGSGSGHSQWDPHLTCLKLGKRHYFEAAPPTHLTAEEHVVAEVLGFPVLSTAGNGSKVKRSKTYDDQHEEYYGTVTVVAAAASSAVVPRCQVEGCEVALVNAKEYHRRHKVCEVHSKAPKVVVLGLEQRFCQQCSRFHAVSEFDETKRSCRRRLAGHNERRRKSSQDYSISGRSSQERKKLMSAKHPCIPLNTAGRALSLLSSKKEDPSFMPSPPDDLPLRCSAALRELIAEKRVAILAKELIHDRERHWQHHEMDVFTGHQLMNSSSCMWFQQNQVETADPYSHDCKGNGGM